MHTDARRAESRVVAFESNPFPRGGSREIEPRVRIATRFIAESTDVTARPASSRPVSNVTYLSVSSFFFKANQFSYISGAAFFS
jgi:hypothetical protein